MIKAVIAGGGRLSYFLAKSFISKGFDTVIINRKRTDCEELARKLPEATVVYGEGSDLRVLKDAGVDAADIFVALATRDSDNLVMCEVVRHKFSVPRTVTLVNDPDNEVLFKQAGVAVASPTQILSDLVENTAVLDPVFSLFPLEAGKISVGTITLGEKSPAVGNCISDLNIPPESVVAFISRNGDILIPRGNTVFAAGDRVILLSLPEALGPTIRLLQGEE